MKAAPLLVAWHDEKAPIYSIHFQPNGKGRVATGGGDNNVRLWKVETVGKERRVSYLSTLAKHAQAVNVVRWCPEGDSLASAGDDGNVLLWVPSDRQAPALGDDTSDDKETWVVKRMCRSSTGAEIYDLAWSPDGAYFMVGSTDNSVRIFDASTGGQVRHVSEHGHFVQGVAWDPLNEYIATQSSDRSVHIYKLKLNDGQFALANHNQVSKMDLPLRRSSSNTPVPPDFGPRSLSVDASHHLLSSPAPSTPGSPRTSSMSMAMPPPATHSRRSSFGGGSPSIHRSASPAPSMPLPAVMPSASQLLGVNFRSTHIYASETLNSFFRRLSFAPDGSLLLTPAGQYKAHPSHHADGSKVTEDVINTVYIYSRGGLNKPPIAHLPGHKKPSIAVRCSPIFYNLREPTETKDIAIDTTSEVQMSPLPESATKALKTETGDKKPPRHHASLSAVSDTDLEPPEDGPVPVFALPYRIVYAVATRDAVYIYDTQQLHPICIVSNLHYYDFTDLTWSKDGLTLLVSSSDGFCSYISFEPGELGTIWDGPPKEMRESVAPIPAPISISGSLAAALNSPGPSSMRSPSSAMFYPPVARPASPTRSNSASSIATQSSFAHTGPSHLVISNPTPNLTTLPGVAAASPSGGVVTGPSPTPPMTPLPTIAVPAGAASTNSSSLGKREGEPNNDEQNEPKKRRIVPTLVSPPAREPESVEKKD